MRLKNLSIETRTSHISYLLKNYFLNIYVGQEKIIRLVQRGTGAFKRKVHEVWQADKGYKIGFKNNVIVHHTATNLTDYVKKIDKYSSLHALENKNEGKQ